MSERKIALHSSWLEQLAGEFDEDYMKALKKFLEKEYADGKTIYPQKSEYFAALNAAPFDQVKVVILGQDPYHGPGQAHGLCFSVRPSVPPPPSLVNIFKELKNDLGIDNKRQGYLKPWADQGVLLLNSVLTVEAGKAASHQGRGWEKFTDKIIHQLNEKRDHLCFLLWGSYAQKKAAFVDRRRHLVLEAPHPSPLSAHRGFLGSRPFSQINQYLTEKKIPSIDWSLGQ